MDDREGIGLNQFPNRTIEPVGDRKPHQLEIKFPVKFKRVERIEEYDLRKILRSYGEDDRGCL